MTERKCADCPKILERRNTSGYCKSCGNRHKWTPEMRSKLAATTAALWKKRLADPAKAAAMQEAGRKLKAAYPYSENMVLFQEKGVKASAEMRRAWCPQEYRALDDILRRKGYSVAERKSMIADEIASVERKRIEAQSPLERQIERLNNGGRLIDKPSYRRADHDYSLTGNGMAML